MPKRRMIVLAAVVFGILGGSAMAKGPQNIRYTPHNMASGSSNTFYKATNEDEICIFCHTPHGGDLTGQLWNRSMSALKVKTYTHYNSATLNTAIGADTRAVSNESLLCLSCHDGSIAMNQIMNYSNSTGGQPDNTMTIQGMFGQVAGKIGDAPNGSGGLKGVDNDLSDDHPISFSYSGVKSNYDSNGRSGELKTVAAAETAGVRFFGSDKRLECSSCHDPHVDYGDPLLSPNNADANYTKYAPFLIRDNIGSALCLSCHTK